MSLSPGEEFRIRATPSPELLRKLAYLAAQDNDSVLTAGARSTGTAHARSADKAIKAADALMMARLADPAYQALSAQINADLDLMDEASVRALQEIEEELAELRRVRERMLEQAYRDEQGRRIFMTEDGTAAYYEDGTKVTDGDLERHREQLRGRPTWEEMQRFDRRQEELSAERDQIHRYDAERERLRDDLREGKIPQEEAVRREKEIEEAMPERMRVHYARLRDPQAEAAAAQPALSAAERALLDGGSAPPSETAVSKPATPQAPSL